MKPLFGVLGAIWFLLVAGGGAFSLFGLIDTPLGRLLDLASEQGVYKWFSQLLLAGSGVLLALIGLRREHQSRWRRTEWIILSGLLFFASLDETIGIHEGAGVLVDPAATAGSPHGYLWVVPYGLFVTAGLLAAIPFFRGLPRRTAWLFGAAAATYLAGTLGFETLGNWLFSLEGMNTGLGYWAAVTTEEGLEGLGAVIFFYALMSSFNDLGAEP